MDVEKGLGLANEAVVALRRAESARQGWLRAERDDDGAELEWAEARHEAFGAVAIAARLAHLVEGAPAMQEFEPDDHDSFEQPLRAAMRLVALLKNYEDLEALARSSSPGVSVESLHRWVWSAASSFWSDGHYRAGVHAAAAQVELHLQTKLDRHDISGAALFRQAFSLDPPQVGRPRLRFSEFREGSERFKSIHEGSGSFCAGFIQAFRNTAAHDPLRPLSADIAIEQLTGLSLIARIIGSADVHRHPDDTTTAQD